MTQTHKTLSNLLKYVILECIFKDKIQDALLHLLSSQSIKHLLAKRTCYSTEKATRGVFIVTREMHHMTALHSTQRFCRFKHGLLTYWAAALQPLRDAYMSIIFCHINACIAPHTMTKVNTESFSFPAYVAIRTVINLLILVIIVEIANGTNIFRKRSPIRITIGIDTF